MKMCYHERCRRPGDSCTGGSSGHRQKEEGRRNGAVERAQRTHTEEFYEVTACSWTIEALNHELAQWEGIYNTVRPHQALGYLTPLQFL